LYNYLLIIQIVPTESAVVPGVQNAEAVGMHKNHRTMVRFSAASDQDYQAVATRILLMTETASTRVPKKWDTWSKMQGK
jgi:hypothetical protein